MEITELEISLMLKRGEVKLLNRTFAAWYFLVTTYYGRTVDITINEAHNKVECECYYASLCYTAKNMEKCRYVKACREFIMRQEDKDGRTKQ
jgi:hypothetical protein